jgi:hypothetical protein
MRPPLAFVFLGFMVALLLELPAPVQAGQGFKEFPVPTAASYPQGITDG